MLLDTRHKRRCACVYVSVNQCVRDVYVIRVCACLCLFVTFHTQEEINTIQYDCERGTICVC